MNMEEKLQEKISKAENKIAFFSKDPKEFYDDYKDVLAANRIDIAFWAGYKACAKELQSEL